MAHGVGIFGRSTVIYAVLKFAKYFTTVPLVPVHPPDLETSTGNPIVGILPNGHGWALTTAGLEFTTNSDSSHAPFSFIRAPFSFSKIDDVIKIGSHITVVGVINFLPILKSSNDLGDTWKTVNLPTGSSNAGGARFVTQNGTLIGMLVTDVTSSNFSAAEWYATPDGGLTWTHHSMPEGGVVTVAGGVLWLAGGPQFASLYKSADLGANWTKVSVPTAAIRSGAALSVPGQLKNGNVVLVATRPTGERPPAIFRVSVYVSSDHAASWKVLAGTDLVGNVGPGVTIAASVVANSVWLGGMTNQGISVISNKGTLTQTSRMKIETRNMKLDYPVGWITSIMPFGNSSAWVTTVIGTCPSGKSSCKKTSALMGTSDGGKTWSSVDLISVPTS